jgi:hypothetical protein
MNNIDCSRCGSTSAPLDEPKSQAVKDFLSNTYFKIVCSTCTETIEKLLIAAKNNPFPENGLPMLENVHYYIENGLWVFTEQYHLSRGFCCKNGCRHCAYGYKKKSIT